MTTTEYAARRGGRHHLEAYIGLSEQSGVPLNVILGMRDLAPLFDPSCGKLIYRGPDPLQRRLNLEERSAARRLPVCECGHRHRAAETCPYAANDPPALTVVDSVYQSFRQRRDPNTGAWQPYDPDEIGAL